MVASNQVKLKKNISEMYRPKQYFSIDEERSSTLRRIYMAGKGNEIFRALQILNLEFNFRFSGTIILPLLLSFGSLSVLCGVIGICFHQSIHIIYVCLFITFPCVSILGIIVTFPMASNVYTASASYIRLYRHQKISDHNMAFISSCHSLKVRIGPFYSFTKATTISALGFMAYITLRIVVALK
jgi:hypothetical protein